MKTKIFFFQLENKLEHKNILSKQVYSIKRNEKNDIVRFKARLVAQEFLQEKGEDFEDVYSPVVNFSKSIFYYPNLFVWMDKLPDIYIYIYI